MVEVFKTNIADNLTAHMITRELSHHYPNGRINFDLDDCDNILRVESENIAPEHITNLLTCKGFFCEVLE